MHFCILILDDARGGLLEFRSDNPVELLLSREAVSWEIPEKLVRNYVVQL